MTSKPSLLMWWILFLIASCGNPSKTNAIIVATQPAVADTLKIPSVPIKQERQIDDSPFLVAHSEDLVQLLGQLTSWTVSVKPADSLDRIDFPYLGVRLPEYSEEVLIFPYLDTAFGGYLTKIVVPFALADWNDGYVIQHAHWWPTSATWIKRWFPKFVATLQAWSTPHYPDLVTQDPVADEFD